jgi:hypothetical protein
VIRPIVEARLKKYPRDADTPNYYRILCGRETGPARFDCAGFLGRAVAMYWPTDRGLEIGYFSLSGEDTLGRNDLTIGLCSLETAVVMTGPGEDWNWRWSGEWSRMWVADHDRSYQRLADGDFRVLAERSLFHEPWRVRSQGVPTGRRPLPAEIVARVAGQVEESDNPRFGLAPRGYGIVGARPTLPAIIRCPHCGARNVVNPPSG